MINIQLYRNYSDNNYVSKDIRPIAGGELTARAPHEVSIISPVLTFDYNTAFLLGNYAYISEFGRYYFIKNIITDTAKRVHLELSVDPLMSFASQIRQCTAQIIRLEDVGAPTEIPDNKLPVVPNRKHIDSKTVFSPDITDTFINDIRSLNYVVTVIGGDSV